MRLTTSGVVLCTTPLNTAATRCVPTLNASRQKCAQRHRHAVAGAIHENRIAPGRRRNRPWACCVDKQLVMPNGRSFISSIPTPVSKQPRTTKLNPHVNIRTSNATNTNTSHDDDPNGIVLAKESTKHHQNESKPVAAEAPIIVATSNNTSNNSNDQNNLPQPLHTPLSDREVRHLVRTVSILTGSQFVVNMGFGVIIPVLPLFGAEMGLGALGLGVLLSAPSLARIALNRTMGQMSDKYGRKPMMIVGTLISSTGGVLTGMSMSLLTLLPARLMVGVGSSASMSGSTAMMADLTDRAPQHRAKMIGVQQAVVNAAFVAGPALGGFLCEAYGARAAFYAVGAAGVLCSFGYSFLPETSPAKTRRTTTGSEQQQATTAANQKEGVIQSSTSGAHKKEEISWLELLQSPGQRAVVAMTSAVYLGYAAEISIVPLHASQMWGATPWDLGLLFSAASFAGLAATPLGGYLADRVGYRTAILPSSVMLAAGFAAMSVSDNYDTFLMSFMLCGFGIGLVGPGVSALAADTAPQGARGEALALSRQAGDVSFFAGPITLGLLASTFGNTCALGAVSAIVLGCSAVVMQLPPDDVKS